MQPVSGPDGVREPVSSERGGVSHTWVPVTRCLNCGNLEDALIRLARCLPDRLRRSTVTGPQ